MIDPIIFTINILGFTFSLRWYGVLVITGILIGTWIASKEVRRRGENPEHIADAVVWLVVAGVIGARLWYVVNAILGGDHYYLDNPLQIINIPAGGLHFYGGLLFGAIALVIYIRRYKLDLLLFLDSIAPATLIGQAVARPANYINQELYGPPTVMPWGIPIDQAQRITPFNDIAQYPLETTRFHPTFAYEMIWNFAAAGLLLWAGRRFPKAFPPGAMFAAWLVAAGLGRVLIETFRPDQPVIPGTTLSYSRLVALLMALAGVLMLLIRYRIIRLGNGLLARERYQLSPAPEKPTT